MTDLVAGLFDLPAKIAVERGLAEFRAGRPVVFAAEGSVIAVPVDALDEERLRRFIGTFARSSDAPPLRLAVTARRARALGIDTERPIALTLDGSEGLGTIHCLAADASAPRAVAADPARTGPIAAMQLGKPGPPPPALPVVDASR